MAPEAAVERELILATVAVDATHRDEVVERVVGFGGEVLDGAEDKLTVMLADSPEILDDFERLLSGYKIVELQRTGRVALPKLGRSGDAR